MGQDQNKGKPIFSGVLDREMDRRGLTEVAVASAAKVSQATVNAWRAGSIPRADALHRLAVYLGVSMEYLLTGSGAPVSWMVAEDTPPQKSEELQRLVKELLTVARALEREVCR